MTDTQEILKQLQDIKLQQVRLEGHIKSEVGNHTRQLDDLWKRDNDQEKRIRVLEDWKNNMQGRIIVAAFFVGIGAGILIGVGVWLITKN